MPTVGRLCRCVDALFDDAVEWRDLVAAGDPVDQITPERHAELAAGFLQAGEGVAALATEITAGSSADFLLEHVATNIALATIGVQWYLGPFQYQQQFGFILVQPQQ